MHEMGIAIELYRTCRETVREHGEGRLRHVKITVGELAAVEPDLLSFGWEAVIADTPDEGAQLEIEFCRADNEAKGTPPGVRRITKNTGISTKEMYQLFPKGPGVLSSKIAGLSKPKGCI